MDKQEIIDVLNEMLHMASYSSDVEQLDKFEEAIEEVKKIIDCQ